MRTHGFLGTSALSSVLLLGFAFAAAGPAYAAPDAKAASADSAQPDQPSAPDAQPPAPGDAEQQAARQEASAGEQSIVVTGTRINRPNLTSSVPITTVSGPELRATGNISLGDTLTQLPQLRATFTQANSTRFIGTAGLNQLDLRGLGPNRTLVLVDGRRHVTAVPGSSVVDVNAIPTDLVERVDVVTGGNSAIYGSDAVAGVVNFVMKRNFDGLLVRGQGGISSRGDRGSYFGSITFGRNFADGRGNIAISAEYAKQNTLYFTDRDNQTGAFSGRTQFDSTENVGPNLNPSAGALHPAEPSTGNGIPDTAFMTGIRNNNASEGGLFTASCPTVAAAGESAAAFAARRAAACSGLPNPSSSNALAQFGRTFVFLPNGVLAPNNCTADLRPFGSANCVGGLGSTLRLTGMLEPGLERKDVNLLAHFEVSPAFVPFVEAKYVDINANQEGQPTFFNNTFSINNPFLSADARATLSQVLAPGTTTFSALRFNIDFGGRGELHRKKTYQASVGADGTFNGDWKYQVAFTYGKFTEYYQTAGNVLLSRYANSINAVRNSAGQIVCGINADASTTNDDPACVPVNLFGAGNVSQAALNYFGYTSSRHQKAQLYDGLAYVSGDSSQLFSLPGGPIGFVLGVEARRETAFSAYDPTTASGATFLNAIAPFNPPAEVTKEAFGEINIPLLKDVPFARELSVDAAGRFSHYNVGKTGTVFAWNVNGTWAPVRDLRFRAGYARSIRAPTLGELYTAASQSFINNFQDPCGQQNINNNPNRVKNCAAAGVPTTQTFTVGGVTSTEPFTNRPASGVAFANRGNPDLQAERSTSLTVGGVFQPRFVPGLSLSVDYYRINVKNVIFTLLGQTVVNQCYDNPGGINNPFCSVVFRNPNGTFIGQSDVQHAGSTVSLTPTGFSVISQGFNFAKQITRGIDFDVLYRHRMASDLTLSVRAIGTRTLERQNYTDITNPNFAIRALGVLGDPAWSGQLSMNLEWGMFNFGYRGRLIGRTVISTAYETQNPFQGRPPLNPDAFPRIWFPIETYHDFRIDITPNRKFRFYVGVDNAFDKLPPYGLLGNEGGDPYSPTGRFFYAGAEVNF